VLGQRGGLRKLDAVLGDESLLWQIVALRLAAIVCHARTDVVTRGLRLARGKSSIEIHVPRTWLREQPRAVYLLREEAQAWTRAARLAMSLV